MEEIGVDAIEPTEPDPFAVDEPESDTVKLPVEGAPVLDSIKPPADDFSEGKPIVPSIGAPEGQPTAPPAEISPRQSVVPPPVVARPLYAAVPQPEETEPMAPLDLPAQTAAPAATQAGTTGTYTAPTPVAASLTATAAPPRTAPRDSAAFARIPGLIPPCAPQCPEKRLVICPLTKPLTEDEKRRTCAILRCTCVCREFCLHCRARLPRSDKNNCGCPCHVACPLDCHHPCRCHNQLHQLFRSHWYVREDCLCKFCSHCQRYHQ